MAPARRAQSGSVSRLMSSIEARPPEAMTGISSLSASAIVLSRLSPASAPSRAGEGGNVRGLRPTLKSGYALAGVHADRNPARVEPRRLADEIGIADRRGSDDDPSDTALQPAAHGLHVANSAAELQLNREPGENVSNGIGVHWLASERPVEIDDVKIVEPLRDERSCLSSGVRVERCRSRHIALDEANALAVLEIDGGKEDHGRHLRKLAISLSPSVWLFSG